MIDGGPFAGLTPGGYGAILADPPWQFLTRSPKGDGRSASQHYQTMTMADIRALPVPELAAKDCALFLWTVDPSLPEAFELLKYWGFQFKTVGFYWAKTNRKSPGFHLGMGYWTRANAEQCWLAVRGNPKRLETGRSIRRLLVSPVREHSRKPDDVNDKIEKLVAGPYLELFARTERPGWTSWGNQTGRFGSALTPDLQAAE